MTLPQHDIASYTAKRPQLVCWQASISVNWAVGGICKVFARILEHVSRAETIVLLWRYINKIELNWIFR